MRLLDEQERPKPPKADTPEAREARIRFHEQRIAALGLSGPDWDKTARRNAQLARGFKPQQPSLKQRREAEAARRRAATFDRLTVDDKAYAMHLRGRSAKHIADTLGLTTLAVHHAVRRGERRARGEAA